VIIEREVRMIEIRNRERFNRRNYHNNMRNYHNNRNYNNASVMLNGGFLYIKIPDIIEIGFPLIIGREYDGYRRR